MAFALHPALSFCRIEDRHVFMDSERDRYFCLAGPLEAAFAAFLAGDPAPAAVLAKHGLIVPAAAPAALRPCPAASAHASLLDEPPAAAWRRHVPGLLAALATTRIRLRRQGLTALLARLEAWRERGQHCAAPVRARRAAADPDAALRAIARALEYLALFVTRHDQCLVRSLALALYLARRQIAAELIFAVRLRPFQAHCWVERDGWILNDRLDAASHFTPIRRA